MKAPPFLVAFSLIMLSSAAAQTPASPRLGAAVNAASYAAAELPHGELAPGALVVLFGEGLGPDQTAHSQGFPLPQTLAGTTVEVAVGEFTAQAPLIYVGATQAAIVLPSRTPPGAAELTVTVEGVRGEPLPIEVAPRRFGIFSLDSSGQGVGVFTYASGDPPLVNGLVASANPGEVWTLWGTGLGAAAGDDASGPLPGALASAAQLPEVEVLVGGEPVETIYQGRSGCCAGLDQISFTVPVGAAGCAVPVQVFADGVLSNTVTMSIALSGRTCIDQEGIFSTDLLERVDHSSMFRLGSISLGRGVTYRSSGPPTISDSLGAQFYAQPLNGILGAPYYRPMFFGACYVQQFRVTRDLIDRTRDLRVPLDAGPAITLTGPNGSVEAPLNDSLQYSLTSLNGEVELPEGEYSFQGFGGPDVGAFTTAARVYPRVRWTNREAIGRTVDRAQPLEVVWEAEGLEGLIVVTGRSRSVATPDLQVGALFRCLAPADSGSFTIPAEVLSSLPQSIDNGDGPKGLLTVGIDRLLGSFQAESGLDLGFVQYVQDEIQDGVAYR